MLGYLQQVQHQRYLLGLLITLSFFFSRPKELPDDMSINNGIIFEHLVFPQTIFPHKRQWCLRLIKVNVLLL